MAGKVLYAASLKAQHCVITSYSIHYTKLYECGVATNRTNTMERVLIEHKLTKSFDIVVTASDVANPKPFPDQLEKIMRVYALLPRQVVFIGDSIYDKKAAESADTWFIAFKQPGLEAHAHAVSMDA